MSSNANSTFDPNTQPVTIYLADGTTPVTVQLSDIDYLNFYRVASSVNFGAQMGACLVMFLIVIVLTQESKRRTAIFLLNASSLLLGFLRALLLALYFVSPWANTYPQLSADFNYIPRSAYATSVAGAVFPFLMTITVNMSLVLQAHTVCKNMARVYRYIITGLAFLVFFVAVGFRFAEMITNSMSIMSLETYFTKIWIQAGTLATETSSIWFFSIIFTGKLVWTLVTRRIMGWKQWSGVRILAAMGGCTMIIPSVFAALEYATIDNFPEAGTLAMTMVALLLPLSSLWAGMAIDQETSTLNLSNLSGSYASRRGSDTAPDANKSLSSQSSGHEFSTDRKFSLAQAGEIPIASSTEHNRSSARDSTELDLEAMGFRVHES